MKKLIVLPVILVALFALTGCSDDNNPTAVASGDSMEKVKPSERTTLADVAIAINAETGEFSTLIAAVVSADLLGALQGNGQLTVFAPTDEAFAKIGYDADNIGDLDKDALTNILLYHIAKGRRMAEDVVSSSQIRMLNKQFTEISLMDEGAFIDESKIVGTDVPADNGIIHVIDAVLLP